MWSWIHTWLCTHLYCIVCLLQEESQNLLTSHPFCSSGTTKTWQTCMAMVDTAKKVSAARYYPVCDKMEETYALLPTTTTFWLHCSNVLHVQCRVWHSHHGRNGVEQHLWGSGESSKYYYRPDGTVELHGVCKYCALCEQAVESLSDKLFKFCFATSHVFSNLSGAACKHQNADVGKFPKSAYL